MIYMNNQNTIKIFFTIIFFTITFTAHTQTDTSAAATLEIDRIDQMIEEDINRTVRNKVVEKLALSSNEIFVFDPVYKAYNEEKKSLLEKKLSLLRAYKYKSDHDFYNLQDIRTKDLFKAYHDVEKSIAELENKYYQKFTQNLPEEKVFNFFLLEEMFDNQLFNDLIYDVIPAALIIQDVKNEMSFQNHRNNTFSRGNQLYSYENDQLKWMEWSGQEDVKQFSEWVQNNKSAKIDHQFIYKGMHKMVNAIWAISYADNAKIRFFEEKKNDIISLVDSIYNFPPLNIHKAELKKALLEAAYLLKSVEDKVTPVEQTYWSNKLIDYANAIDSNISVDHQREIIYVYFSHASSSIEELANHTHWEQKEKPSPDGSASE